MKSARLMAVVLGALLLPAALAAQKQPSFEQGFNFFSPQEDVELGRQGAAEVDQQVSLIKDTEVLRYVSELGQALVRCEPVASQYPWTFKVINSRDINAFALPGGFIYINRGAIEAAQDEAQLAGVIAHETGHVVMRHGTHQASEALLVRMPLEFLSGLLGQNSSLVSDLAQAGISFGVNSVLLHYSRSAETEADEVGTYVLYHAGYDPFAMVQFFQIIQKKYPRQTLQFFSNHPNPENRIQTVEQEIPQLGPRKEGKRDSAEFDAIKARLLAMPPPPEPSSPAP
jgi:predicted Zn-dependent protease